MGGQLRQAITSGRLPVGTVLPPTRELAADLGWARGVVVDAYDRLAEEGLTSGRARGGTRVTFAGTPGPRTTSACTAVADVAFDLTPGVPDLTRFPRAAWLRSERQVLETADALRYGDPAGDPELRRELASWLAIHRGVLATPEEIIVVSGVAQALALVAHVLRRRGATRIGVEDPGSRGAREELAYWGLEPVPLSIDAAGLRTDALPRVDAVMVTPAHQFPTGVALGADRRVELVRWAERHDAFVVEDDYDAELRYDRSPTASVHASAPQRVVHTGSVSKSLAPALRLGWLVAPAALHAELLEAKHASDIASPALPQRVLARMMADGGYERHLRSTRRHQRRRRDELAGALQELLPTARIGGLDAGLHLVLDLDGVDDSELAALLAERGVVVDPLSRHRMRPGPPGLVLGYAAMPPDRLRTAAALIAQAVRDLS